MARTAPHDASCSLLTTAQPFFFLLPLRVLAFLPRSPTSSLSLLAPCPPAPAMLLALPTEPESEAAAEPPPPPRCGRKGNTAARSRTRPRQAMVRSGTVSFFLEKV
uniref:Uncharacterized protein n=1 Tax=Arundo donax TaxID=35708 RepID=A0A0A9DY09_ARUDO